MLKLLFAVLALIVLAMVAGAYLQFDPSWPILGILAFGIFMVGRIGDVPPGGKPTHWGGGHGIYFNGDDIWVSGSDEDTRPRDD